MLDLMPETRPVKTVGSKGTTLRDMVYVLFRRRWIILGVALPIILVGGLSLFRQTGSYTAASRIVVELTKVDLPQWNTNGRNLDYDRELSTLFTIAMSVPVGEKAAAALEDSIPVIRTLDQNLAGMETLGDLQELLIGGLDVSVVGESSILEFRFSSAHPRISLMAVGALRDAFVEYQVHGRKNPRAMAYYSEQMTAIRSDVDSLLGVRGQILNDSGYSSLNDELRYKSGQLSELESQLLKAVTVRRSLELQYETLKGYLDDDPRDFPMGQDENRSHTLVYWRNTVSKYDDQLNSILSIHTDDSIPVRRHRRKLDGAVESLKNEARAYVESIGMSLTTAQQREQVLQDQVADLRSSNREGPTLYHKISLIDVEIKSLRDLLDALQGKWGEVRLNQLADERVSSVVALTEPELTMVISGGKTVVYFIMIAFLALALGVVVAFVLDNFDHRIYGPVDVEENLKLPVFASVTRSD